MYVCTSTPARPHFVTQPPPTISSPLPNYSARSESSALTMGDDVSMEILARLPLKSLFRFACVSKAWRGLISGDDYLRRRLPLLTSAVFYRCQAGDAKEPRYAYTADGPDGLRECPLDFFPLHDKSAIVDCCSGLLLSYAGATSSFYVLSPITKRWAALPPAARSTQLAILAFDPYVSRDYKVISFVGWLPQGSQLEVYSSETGKWAEHIVHWVINSDEMTATIRYLAGILYVLAYPNHIVAIHLDEPMVRCHLIQLPETVKPEGCVDMCGGALHYTCNDGGGRIKVWMLEDSGTGKWSLKHSVEVGAIMKQVPVKMQHQLHLLALHPERYVVYLRVPGKLVTYDLVEQEMGQICEFHKERERAYLVQIWLFPFSRYMSDCLAK